MTINFTDFNFIGVKCKELFLYFSSKKIIC
jgi:hypothetical protein